MEPYRHRVFSFAVSLGERHAAIPGLAGHSRKKTAPHLLMRKLKATHPP